MPFALTCKCGAHLEIDDKFAGQTINCPDCQTPLQAPTSETAGQRTSGLALASMILALVGAFTIVGTIAAIFVGAVALLVISRSSGRIAGRGFAITGIVIGVLMTGGTVLALTRLELFGLVGILSEANWNGKLDTGGPLEVVREKEGFSIKRPSHYWGVYKTPRGNFGDNDLNQSAWEDLLLVLPADDATILCFAMPVNPGEGIDRCREKFERDFRDMDKVGLFTKSGNGLARGSRPTVTVLKTDRLPRKANIDAIELRIDKRQGTEEKAFLVRIVKQLGDDRMFVVIAGVRPARWSRLEGPFREALDSFRLLAANGRGD